MISVGLDATELVGGSAQRGVGTYIRELAHGLARRDDVELTVLAPRPIDGIEGVRWVRVRRSQHHRLAGVGDKVLLPLDARRARVDVFHGPAFNPPWSAGVPVVQTLHDLTPLVFKDPLLARDARAWRRRAPAMRRAARVIAVSRSSALQGIDLLGLDPLRTVVIPHAISPTFSPGPASGRIEPGLLVVSAWGPHKGFREAARAFDLLVERGFDLRMRVVGHNDAWMLAHLERDLSVSRHRSRIDVVGWVPDLVDEYRSASVVLVTSRAEGFGFPAAEALACGARVVAFNNTSLPEVIGAAGVLVPDGDVPAVAEAVHRLLRDGVASAPLAPAERSWAEVVEEHVRAYVDALGSGR